MASLLVDPALVAAVGGSRAAVACIAIRHCHLVDVPCLWPSTLF